MRKKIVSLLLALAMVLAVFPLGAVTVHAAETSGTCGEKATWVFDKASGTLTISGTGEMVCEYKDHIVNITWRDIRDQVKTVVIKPGITSVCYNAFLGFTKLTTVSLPEGLESIDIQAFSGCTALKAIQFPSTLTRIGQSAFHECTSLTEVVIPASVKTLDNTAFFGCKSLRKVTLRSVTSMGINVFVRCDALEEATFGEGCTIVGGGAFEGCKKLTKVELPDSIQQIENHAFDGCESLTNIKIPGNVQRIGAVAFQDCTSLGAEITIPASVTEIGVYAFLNCVKLQVVYFCGAAPKLDKGVFQRSVSDGDDETHYENIPGLTLYYVEGKQGWTSPTWEGYPTKTWEGMCPFVDVAQGKYYYDAVQWAVKQGVTAGVDATHFEPNGTCTRAQVVSFLWRAAGSPEPKTTKNPFVDVQAGKYYYKAVLWAAENGIVYGTDATHFSPNDACTRGQVVCFLYRYQNSPSHGTKIPFQDVKQGSYYCDAVIWAEENGVVYGTDANHFSPNETCTRGQVVCFLYRLLG